MKMLNSSLKSSVILVSLALLPAGVLANISNEPLSFDFSRSDDVNLDPRLGVQADACRTKADPLVINVNFVPKMYTANLKVSLEVHGAGWRKGYAVFSSATKSSTTDTDFQTPWGFSVEGAVKGVSDVPAIIPGQPWKPGQRFCFTDNYPGQGPLFYPASFGYAPIAEPDEHGRVPSWAARELPGVSYRKLWEASCGHHGVQVTEPERHYLWEDPSKLPPQIIHDRYHSNDPNIVTGDKYLKDGYFYTHYIPATHDQVKPGQNWVNFDNDKIEQGSLNPAVIYNFPITGGGSDSTLEKGKFTVTLNNRNISSLVLRVQNGAAAPVIWQWNTADNDVLKNRLLLSHSGTAVGSRGPENSDPYKNFYTPQGKTGFYHGTLAGAGLLNQAYKNYIKQLPLSIPPQVTGEINLVNTDSLTFTIGQDGNYGGPVKVGLFGQPLKFGPMYIGNKVAVSATQMSQLCN